MKAISAKVTRCITLNTKLKCVDNTGARVLQVIAVKGYKGRRRRLPKAGVADIVICTVKKGKEKMRHKIVHAVVVRQRKEYRRKDGTRIKFTDNAAVIINPKTYEPMGTEVRSVVAREVIERFSAIGKICSIVV